MEALHDLLYFDCETLPSDDPDAADRIAETVEAPSNYKDADKIAAYKAEKAADILGKTSFDGWEGRIACIAWADAKGIEFSASAHRDGEKAALETFFGALQEYRRSLTLVGHNIIGFDIPFLTRRAIALGVKLPPSHIWPRAPKPWSDKVHDTMTMAMAGGQDRVSLDKLCRALGIPGKDGFDGSMVADAWAAGEYERVRNYCLSDVRRVTQVHSRFMAAGW